MKIAIMQPYFFPYLGYFSLIKHTDRFVLFDTVQYIYHGWIARNRILKPGGGWQYIGVSLSKHSRNTFIRDIRICNQVDWRRKIVAQLQHYKKTAPFFNDVMMLLDKIFSANYEDILSINATALSAVLEYLNIERKIEILSKMGLDIKPHNEPDECALHICEELGNISEYWNPPGGKSFFDRTKYDKVGIKLQFHEIYLSPYNQKRSTFEPGLSILDVLMFNSADDVNVMLDNFSLS